MNKYELQVWKLKTSPGLRPYKIEVTAQDQMDAKSIAASREGCLESELVYCQYIGEASSSDPSKSSAAADGILLDMTLSLIKWSAIVLYKIVKYTYIFISNKENQDKAKKIIVNIYSFSKRSIFNQKFWEGIGGSVSNKINEIMTQIFLLMK